MYSYGQHLHFVGIGGVGMAGIAEVLLNLGYSISGSDIKASPLTENLERLGAKIAVGHNKDNIPEKTSVVVISSAIGTENPEVKEASERSIPIIPRAEMLAELMRMKYGVAVAGSHGKTTTTSMIAKILSDIGLDPTVIIGGRLLSHPSGAQLGLGQYLVAEADESDGSFNLLRPAIAIVTNVDAEHMSHYGTFGALEAAFLRFMSSVPFYGVVIACLDDPVLARLVSQTKRRVISYGLNPENKYCAKDIRIHQNSSSYSLYVDGNLEASVTLPVPGIHMVSNSLAALAVSIELGAYISEIIESLKTFPGVGRRSEILGDLNGVLYMDDYGHHPTEIKATLKAIRDGWLSTESKKGEGRLHVVFQPHRYSRTRELFSEFLTCFDDADFLYVTEIYAAGESQKDGITGASLAQAMQHHRVTFSPELSQIYQMLQAELKPGDIVLTLGAGNITQFGRKVIASRGYSNE